MRKLISFKTFKKYCGHKNDLREIGGRISCCLADVGAGHSSLCAEKSCSVWERLESQDISKPSLQSFRGVEDFIRRGFK